MNELIFCPKCGSVMIPKKSDKKTYLVCPSCGYTDKKTKAVLEETKAAKEKEEISFIDEKETAQATLPKIEIECPRCKNKEAYFWTVQTRASDEAETRFYRCTKCNHTWREYS